MKEVHEANNVMFATREEVLKFLEKEDPIEEGDDRIHIVHDLPVYDTYDEWEERQTSNLIICDKSYQIWKDCFHSTPLDEIDMIRMCNRQRFGVEKCIKQ